MVRYGGVRADPSAWQTPYVGLLVQGAIATVFRGRESRRYDGKKCLPRLTQTTLVLFFIPILYLFLAYLRLRRDAPSLRPCRAGRVRRRRLLHRARLRPPSR